MPKTSVEPKTWLILGAALVFIGLIIWDHSFQASGWVPSLGANLMTMVATVLVLDTLQRRRQRQAGGVILRSAILNIANVLAHSAQGYQVPKDLQEAWFTPQIPEWKVAAESLDRDSVYGISDLDPPTKELIRELAEQSRYLAENMAWQNFANENIMTSLYLNKMWLLMKKIEAAVYKQDPRMVSIFQQIEEQDIQPMRDRFSKYW